MNYKKAKTILRKLNSLLESFENLGEPLSDIESEMLLRYTDEFRKLVPLEEDMEEPELVKAIKVEKVKPAKKSKKKAPVLKVVEEVIEEEVDIEEPEVIEVVQEVEELVESNVEDAEEETVSEDEVFDVPPVVEKVVKAAAPAKKKPKAKKKSLVATEEEIVEDVDLWEKKEFTELSEKLSFSPIKNIFKSISINERIFTQNELFDGDHLVFRSTLEQLEEKATFEEAVSFLKNGVAKDQKWDSPKKIKKASQFMKLVQRRFL